MHPHQKRILLVSIIALFKALCRALAAGMLLAATALAQTAADRVPTSDWIHFPARTAKKTPPATPSTPAAGAATTSSTAVSTTPVTATALTPASATPTQATAQTASPKADPAEAGAQRPAATSQTATAGDWVQFPPLPPPTAKAATAKAATPVNSAAEQTTSPKPASNKPADTAAASEPQASSKGKAADTSSDKSPDKATKPVTANATANAPAPNTAAPSADAPAQFTFKGFKFEGNTVYSSKILTGLIARQVPVVKELSDIQNAAQAVANRYQEDGVLARVDLLPQDLTEGIVTITITEGKFSGARMESAKSAKLPPDLLTRIVEKAQPVGEAVWLSKMDRATMLLNEVPGVQANVRLSTGQAEGQTEALVQVQDKNPWDGQLTVDNAGTVSAGISRFSSQFNRYGLLGRADVGNLQYMHSQGLDYLRLGYNEPLGYGGARWGLNTEFTHYSVISGYDSLDLHGPSNSLSLYVSQPWIRRRDVSSDWVVTAEHKNFKNISSFSTPQYKLDNLSSTVSMSSQDSLWRGGENNASLQLQRGFVDYDTTPADNTEGAFTKWRLNMSRKNKINESQTLLLSYQRQWANRNLDSSEKFGIGGASAVRAYPGGEVSGSEASVFTTEWQHDLEWNKQPYKFSAFYDLGSITKYKYNATTNNSYSLQGAGLWIGTSIPNRWGQSQWRATWSHRIGSNPGASSSGVDADGTYYLNRFWLSASQVF